MKPTYRKIALLHHAGGGNLGDDAIIHAVIGNIRSRCPATHIAVFTMNLADAEQRYGVPVFPIRRFRWVIGYGADAGSRQPKGRLASTWNIMKRKVSGLFRELAFCVSSFRRLRHFDLLVVSGGGQLTERGGPWSFPYALFVWAWMTKLARVRFMVINVGAGPLRRPLSRFFIARALSAAHYVSFRDEPSRDLATRIGYRETANIFPDSAYATEFEVPVPPVAQSQKLIVGVAPLLYPYCDPREHKQEDLRRIYDDFLAKFAAFTGYLGEKPCSMRLFGSDIGADPAAIQDLHDMVLERYQHDIPSASPVTSVQDLLTEMADMDIVVTCRYHGVVLAHLLNKPVLAIAHHPKVIALMNSLGLGQYCVDIKTFEPAQLIRMFDSLLEHQSEIKVQMANVLATFQQQAANQFDTLFCSLLDDQPSLANQGKPPRMSKGGGRSLTFTEVPQENH